jgi:hypothetical protein
MKLVDAEAWMASMALLAAETELIAASTAKALGHCPVAFETRRNGWRVSWCVYCKEKIGITGSTTRGAMLEAECPGEKHMKARKTRSREKLPALVLTDRCPTPPSHR